MMNNDKYMYHKLVLSGEQRQLNRYLRKGVRDHEPTDKLISNINKALDTVPAYNNKIVYHCGALGLVTVKELLLYFSKRVGKNIQFPSFLSTTKDPEHYFKNQDIIFEIHTCENSNGKDISELDFDKPNEGEVTFKSGTYFRVVSVERGLVVLEELMNIPDVFEVLGEDFYMKDDEIRASFNAQEGQMRSSSDLGRI